MPPQDKFKIFVSYGRADASAFVDRLVADLERAGLSVWRDTSDLVTAVPWDDQIRAALKSCNLVVAVLTPHAVRGATKSTAAAEESVCLDELHAARFDPPPTPILPVLLINCQLPFSIARLNYEDFQNALGDDASYSASIGRLLARIETIKNGFPVPNRTVDIEPLDFDLYLKSKTRDFVGRAWLASDISDWLARPDGGSTLLLVGEPGWGKTAFCGHLFSADPGGQLLAAHFCRADRSDTVSPRRFVQSLIATIALRIPAYGERLHPMLERDPDALTTGAPLQVLESVCLKPLAALEPRAIGNLPRYILVDALDEAESSATGRELHSLLAAATKQFPDWLRLVATTRDRFGIPQSFPGARIVHLDPADERNRDDLRGLIARKLGAAGSAAAGGDAVAQALAAKAGGNALAAAQLAAAAQRGDFDAASIAALPQEMSALYRAMLSQRFDPRGNDWHAIRSVLEMVLATDAAVPIALIASALADTDEYRTREAVGLISDLLVTNDDAIQIFHQTLRDFLNDKTTPFFVNARAGATKLASFAVKADAGKTAPAATQLPLQSQLSAWIARSDDPSRFADQLPAIYEKLFSQKYTLYNPPSDEDFDEHKRLIGSFAAAGRIDDLIGIVDLAMTRAADRLNQIDDRFGNNSDRGKIAETAYSVQGCISITYFVFAFIREVARVAPEAKAKLRDAYDRHKQYVSFFTFLGPALGYRKLGLSSYYEGEGDFLSMDAGKLYQSLG